LNTDRIRRRTLVLLLLPAFAVIAFDLLARVILLRDDHRADALTHESALLHTLAPSEIVRRLAVGLLFIAVAGIVLRRRVDHPAWPLFTASVGTTLGGTLAIFVEQLLMPRQLVANGIFPVSTSSQVLESEPLRGVYDWILFGDMALSPADIAVWAGCATLLLAASALIWSHRSGGRLGGEPLFSFTAPRPELVPAIRADATPRALALLGIRKIAAEGSSG
jgi:hypothetical protein